MKQHSAFSFLENDPFHREIGLKSTLKPKTEFCPTFQKVCLHEAEHLFHANRPSIGSNRTLYFLLAVHTSVC